MQVSTQWLCTQTCYVTESGATPPSPIATVFTRVSLGMHMEPEGHAPLYRLCDRKLFCACARSVDSHLWTPHRTMEPGHSKAPVPVADPVQRGVSLWVHTHTPWDSRDDNSHSTWDAPCAWVVLACHTCCTLLELYLVTAFTLYYCVHLIILV